MLWKNWLFTWYGSEMQCPLCKQELLEVHEGPTITVRTNYYTRECTRKADDYFNIWLMKCPLCNKDLVMIGAMYSKGPFIGWDCPNNVLVDKDSFGSHYSVRGALIIVNIFPFKIETWRKPHEHIGTSDLYHYLEDFGWRKFAVTSAIHLTTEEKLLNKLKVLVIFQ